ncbi:sulfonate ABC transporter substrate-binding protein [Bacillus sp. FJAT-42376]|uniref:sulfonate ABC transporter substrate-binding protein n=1 Tax=Bacillus sp. FJAT-42376 TaxID=2014076 RepID=UPI000F4F90EB|nr:sulfonate ABC transporter substrate-binding protein [Bacillus sp. FJAT-42376]AZB41913.1 sulfonate ABC transporter substrate-binding protein [Bacillus sp. FJAT-42376]
MKKSLSLFLMFILTIGLLSACGSDASNASSKPAEKQSSEKKVIRIGYQKNCPLNILKSQGTLEKKLKEEGISVKWVEFPAGPQLLEALNAGSIDFGRTGDTPPIFAQAAGIEFSYVASGYKKGKTSAVLVPQDSAIQKLQDLKGKKIAFTKGSSAHYLLLSTLKKAGLKYEDIQPVNLTPSDARAAFERKSVDAWIIWDPFLAVAEKEAKARVLTSGDGLANDRDFYLASKSYLKTNKQTIDDVLEEVQKVSDWAKEHPDEVAGYLSPLVGIDEDILKTAVKRRPYGVVKIDAEIEKEQQEIAEAFYSIKLLPKEIKVKEAIAD